MAGLPTELGRYQLIRRIAAGGMAELYEARVRGPHGFAKTVVVKRIHPHLAADPEFITMFIDEARIASRLAHPNIVQVIELDVSADDLFIVMELVDGPDLLALLRHCRRADEMMSPAIAVHIIQQVLDALHYAHNATGDGGEPLGIVHRDVSPGNVLVSSRGDVKLTDFGIARAAVQRHKTQAGTLKGKYGYMSPEQVAGHDLDGRSDVFSAAIVLAELLMARRLFTAPNDLELLLMVRDARIERLGVHGEYIPAPLRAILARALARAPGDRYESAAAFREALGDYLFEARSRPSASDLGELVRAATRADSEPPVLEISSDGIPDLMMDATISGPMTQSAKIAALEAAEIGRALFSNPEAEVSNDAAGPPSIEIWEEDSELIIIEAEASPAHTTGSLADLPPMRLLFDIATERRDGLLITRRGATTKETYFRHGNPQFVRSNVGHERLGEYLVAHGVITRHELSRALSVMPHFGGRLGDTLVGLDLLKPMEAFHHLTGQVHQKLVDVCTWLGGTYEWLEGRENPWPALPLALDTLRVIGDGARAVEDHVLRGWLDDYRSSALRVADHAAVDLAQLGLGQRLDDVYRSVDGDATVGDLVAPMSSEAARLEVTRAAYLLVQTGIVAARRN